VDSSEERDRGRRTLEERIMEAIQRPEEVERTGLVYLGLSDDAVDDVSLWNGGGESWRWLSPRSDGPIELPVWVDHVGSLLTRWRRFCFKMEDHVSGQKPPADRFVEIVRP
jgi:CRISPR-associated protein Cas5t